MNKNPFDQYQKDKVSGTIKLIRKALNILSNGKYDNKTRLAKDVAKLVTEFKIQAFETLPKEKKTFDIKPVSHVTLLRNKDYCDIIEVALANMEGKEVIVEPSYGEIEQLKIRCANLQSQNNNLIRKIQSMDTQGLVTISNNQGSIDELKNKNKQVDFLLHLIDEMHSQVEGAFRLVKEEERSNSNPDAGWYGPMGLVATWNEMEELNRIRNEKNERC